MLENGMLRVYHIQNGNLAHQQIVDTPIQAVIKIETWADEDLQNPNVSFNAFGLEEYDGSDLPEEDKGTDAGWGEWYNADGQDISEILSELEEKLS